MASRMLRRFLCLGILCALLLGAVPAAGAQGGITDEIRRAAALGIGELEHENTVVTYETYFQMLDALVALAAPDKLSQWQSTEPEARTSQEELDRYNGMVSLFLAGITLGGDYIGLDERWVVMNQEIGEPWDGCVLDPVYGELWKEQFELIPGVIWQYDACAYFYAIGRYSRVSDQMCFDYDAGRNSVRPEDPLLYREAQLSVLRLYESAESTFPESDRWETPEDREMQALRDQRREEILNTSTQVEVTGTCYYVSNDGDDSNDGLSPETAWATLHQANNSGAQPGDGIFFRRGDLWRGTLQCVPGVTYSAYGEGEKPKIYGSPENGAGGEKWELWYDQDGVKIWKFYTDIADCGNIVMNDGQTCALRVFSYWDGEKAVFSDRMEEEFDIVEGLAHDLQFYSTFDMAAHQPADPSETYWVHNVDSRGPLYLRCDAGNPGELYDSIEFQSAVGVAEGYWAIVDCVGDNVIDNLCLMYRSTIGIDLSHGGNNRVQNCEIGWIGGGSHALNYESEYGEKWVPTSGECIRMEGNDTAAVNCYVHDSFDGGVTMEFDEQYLGAGYECLNMIATGNLIENCMAGVLIGDHNRDWENTRETFGAVTIADNLIFDSGYGWSGEDNYHRTWMGVTDSGNAITLWDGPTYNSGITVENNVLYRARHALVMMGTDAENSPDFSGNTYCQNNNGIWVYRRVFLENNSMMEPYYAVTGERMEYVCTQLLGDTAPRVLAPSACPQAEFTVEGDRLAGTVSFELSGLPGELLLAAALVDGDSGQMLDVFTWERTGGGRERVSFSCPLPEGERLELRTFVLCNDGTLIPAQQALRYIVEAGTINPT